MVRVAWLSSDQRPRRRAPGRHRSTGAVEERALLRAAERGVVRRDAPAAARRPGEGQGNRIRRI